ncbi:MAG: methylated-DNA--[protein]-cysteine S-methyltransferase [Alistipes sp.]|jgi:methylated-DNA-[protein]-cysteine S-methyltransferase|nr:methylated-DNA--[protein]-cysteine S-methyltransferase [Alistipes sp.]
MEKITSFIYHSPVGELMLASFDGRLCLCDWEAGRSREVVRRRLERRLGARFEAGTKPVIELAARQLDEYFDGRRREFNVPLLFAGTDFQCAVWETLMTIPYGTTISYSDMAARMGMPRAVRAVAGANRVNAISVIVPCHRVIGANGALTGYGGGLDVKEALIAAELGIHSAIGLTETPMPLPPSPRGFTSPELNCR